MKANALSANLSAEALKNLWGDAVLHMIWHLKSDPRFHYWCYIPEGYYDEGEDRKSYPLIVIVHGTGRDNTEYWAEAKKYAELNHVALLAPNFPAGLFDHMELNSYKLLSCDGLRYDNILLSMVEEAGERFPGVETEKFCMFGFSGGGQFTNRFLFVHPERLKAASIGAPGRPTYLNFDQDYFWGVRDFRKHFDKDIDISAIAKVPVEIMVGDQDVLYIGDSPYGTTRVERNTRLKENLEAYGVKVQLDLLPGLTHLSGRTEKMQAALRFFDNYIRS